MLTRENVMPGMLLRTNLSNIRLLSVDGSPAIWADVGDFLVVTDVSRATGQIYTSDWHVLITLLHLRTQRLCRLMFFPNTDRSHDFIYFDFMDFE